jgi:hypothetical protein
LEAAAFAGHGQAGHALHAWKELFHAVREVAHAAKEIVRESMDGEDKKR